MCNLNEQILFLYLNKYSTVIIQLLGIFFNFVAIYFLKNDDKCAKKSYKLIVIIHCLLDISLGTCYFLGIYQIEIIENTVFIMVDGPLQYINSYTVHALSYITTTFFFCSSVFCGCITIIYRYLVIVRNKNIKTNGIILMLIPVFVLSAIISLQYFFTFCPPKRSDYYIYKNLLENKNWNNTKLYRNEFIALIIPSFRVVTPIYKLLEIISYLVATIIIILFKILISRYLKNKKNSMSLSTLKKEKQTQRTLIIQALLPILLVYTPNILLTFAIILHIPLKCYTTFITYCVTYVPLINPCIILFLTSQYRTKLFHYIRISKNSVGPSKVSFHLK
uniref:G-protein coupled receptors family 1 profile domain-containing protein n=1 Tax=Strongyloides stercoralis TaxID=6248 RepID=A0AAF5DH63_STRER